MNKISAHFSLVNARCLTLKCSAACGSLRNDSDPLQECRIQETCKKPNDSHLG